MLPTFCRDEVTVYRAPWIDQRGTKVRDWSHAASHAETGCSFQIGSTQSNTGEPRENEQSEATLYLPPSADIEAGDRVEFMGEAWAVDGDPYFRASPFGGLDHKRADLRRWQG